MSCARLRGMRSLDDVLTPRRLEGDVFALDVPDGWQQGRSAFGGLGIGALVRACEAVVTDPSRMPRSLTAELTGPLEPGTATLRARVLRAGNTVTTVAASIEQRDETVAHAVLVLGAKRALVPPLRPMPAAVAAPVVARWEDTPVLPFASPPWPRFAENFEMRLVEGPPFLGGEDARTTGWVRPHLPSSRIDAAYVAALADAYWSAAAARFEGIRPFATVAFSLAWTAEVAVVEPNVPLLHRAVAIAEHEGYVVEDRELWTPGGRLVSMNRQTFVVIK